MSDYVAGGVPEGMVPRTTDARSTREVVVLASRRRQPSVAMWGMAMLIASEATLLVAMIASYYYLRFTTATWPPPPDPRPEVVTPLILVGVLATTSLPMQLAAFAARTGRLAAARFSLVWALVIQVGYLVYEVHDFARQVHHDPISTDAYSSIYFTLLGADHGHVCVGILLTTWLLWKLMRGLTMYRLNAVQVVAFYWHVVNLLTLVITGVLLSATF
jgi:cytochrome c oxidase subunit 3/cytochrome c oxidase subunit I+III